MLGLGTGQLLVFDWEMEKWFHLRIGDERFGWKGGNLRFGFWGLGAGSAGEKKLGNFDWEKGSQNALWEENFRAGFWDLPKAS